MANANARRGVTRRWALALIASVLPLAASCGGSGALDWGLESPRAVAEAVIRALDEGNATALERLAVNEREFRQLVWPRQPAARPERNIPWDYAWKTLSARSRQQLSGRLSEWTRQAGVTVADLRFTGETTDYGAYRVHRKSVVTLRDSSGRQQTLRVFGSLIEQGGRYRVFSYVVD